MPAYSKTTWVNGSTPAINATNLNKIEQGIADAVRKDGSEAMTAQLVTVAGSAATPAIAPTGDSNTGIFFPAADTIAFGEGGTEAMRITSAGNVGIGTTSPSVKLEIGGDTINTNNAFFTSGASDAGFKLGFANGSGSTANSEHAVLSFAYSGTRIGGIGFNRGGTANCGAITFFTNANNERMRIDVNGNVGIGTTSPTSQLHVYNNGGAASSMVETNTTGGDAKVALKTNGTGGRHWYWQTGDNGSGLNGRLRLWDSTAGAERLTILDSGNVGIGTTSPSAKLTVQDASDAKIYSTRTSGATAMLEGGGSAGYLKTTTNHAFVFGTNGADNMVLTTAGYLLIGYASSNGAYPLQVNGQIFATSSTIATSDGKYKKDIVTLDGALDIVKALNPVQFNWKEHPVHKFNTDVPTVGFIAQEVEQALSDKSYLTSIIKKSECTWETETGETIDREVTRDVEKQVTREVEREVTETIDGEEVTRTITEEVTETIIEQVTEIVTDPVKETHTEEFLGIAESNLIAILTKAVKELTAKVEALEARI